MKKKRVRGAESAREPAEEVFDPEGWMSERPLYWLQLPEIEPPTRAAWLRHRAREFATWLHLAERKRDPQITEEQWIALSEQALGPLPRPERTPPKKPRSATPNAGKSARKPAAYSQERAPGVAPR
jgi:hypothetical protein